MFRTLIYPSSGACDFSVELPHWSYCSWFDVCWSFGVVGLEWYPCWNLQHGYNSNPTTPKQNSRKLLMIDILMSETCWAHKKWNKIASDIKLVFYSSTITLMHGPINTSFANIVCLAHANDCCTSDTRLTMQRWQTVGWSVRPTLIGQPGVGLCKERDHLEDLGVDGRVILKRILK